LPLHFQSESHTTTADRSFYGWVVSPWHFAPINLAFFVVSAILVVIVVIVVVVLIAGLLRRSG
jgi:uncharacterized membrane protein